MSHDEVKVDVEGSVFKHLPRKQPPCPRGMLVRRAVTEMDLYRAAKRGGAERLLTKTAGGVYTELAVGLVRRLVNAGPHILDLSLSHAHDDEMHAERIVASAKIVPAKTFGDEISNADLHATVLSRPSRGLVSPRKKPSLWERFVAWGTTDLTYDGPRGTIDQ